MGKERLDKIISSQLNISRSDARTEIRRGKVAVNGETVKDASCICDAVSSEITFGGNLLVYREHIYLVMNKPKGVLSASSDKRRETVVDLVPDSLKRKDLFPVGRLDKDTTGLILITDDGEFAHNVISPKKEIEKTYVAVLDGKITESCITALESGITLADGTKCLPAKAEIIGENVIKIRIYEGKYHQIKRMLGVVGLGVNELERIKIGKFALPDDLKEGQCREMTAEEMNFIFE